MRQIILNNPRKRREFAVRSLSLSKKQDTAAPVPSPGVFGGLSPPKQSSKRPKLKYEKAMQISGDFVKLQNAKPPCRRLSGDGSEQHVSHLGCSARPNFCRSRFTLIQRNSEAWATKQV